MTPPPPRSTLFPYTTLFRSLSRSLALDSARAERSHSQRGRGAGVDLQPGPPVLRARLGERDRRRDLGPRRRARLQDRKSTRLNSSHPSISYAVFCLKKKKKP